MGNRMSLRSFAFVNVIILIVLLFSTSLSQNQTKTSDDISRPNQDSTLAQMKGIHFQQQAMNTKIELIEALLNFQKIESQITSGTRYTKAARFDSMVLSDSAASLLQQYTHKLEPK